MIELLVGVPEADAWAGFIMREQSQPTEAFDLIYDRTMGRIIGVVTLLLGRLTGTSPEDATTRLRALTIMGQLLIMRTSRAGVLRTMRWPEYRAENVAQILDLVTQQTDAIVEAANA